MPRPQAISPKSSSPAQDLEPLRHSAAHILAQAVKRLWPQATLAIGPPIDEGFYYDIEFPAPVTDEDLPKIEAEMRKIIAENHPFTRSSTPRAQALQALEARQDRFKAEIVKGLTDAEVSFYTDGEFTDLCAGPHVHSTGEVKVVKLLSVAGAYWRGDEHNPQLTRIYGTAFPTQQALDEFLKVREEAKRRDHRKLGPALGLFTILDQAGPGLVFYLPKGAMVRQTIEQYLRDQHAAHGYLPVATPHLLRAEVWQRSGHYGYYKENMYIFKVENQEFGVKPMNCPGHILIYETGLRSYRELPLRFFELGTVYRNEKSGVLHGLLRVRGFTQDDAHIFCRPGQLEEEIRRVVDFTLQVMRDFGFTAFDVEVSTRPEKFLGEPAQWDQAEQILQRVLTAAQLPFTVQAGEGAFYGPKIDVKVKDALGRVWQCATVQLDFVLPQRFNLTYIEEDGRAAPPVMIHRAILGSLERFFGMLLEQYAGALPTWLAPVQLVIIPIAEAHQQYARELAAQAKVLGVRVELDDRNERMQAKIRDAQMQKVPYMFVVGNREQAAQAVAVRTRAGGDQGLQPSADALAAIQQAITTRRLD
ncbi:MAG: threonine--tRNA ligase [Omnitrophica WOR_2 bacterium RIFCSPHIGHO2_02_FULL_68_15]|nr:MAG: threonine--tRNA ligase [Omnitrophica WOR_2 bacterium RIFCSPHIGHO2_02_FULL_68_15]